MKGYYSIVGNYNRYVILALMLAPFAAYVSLGILGIDFIRLFTLVTYIGVILIFLYADKKNPIKMPNYLWFFLFFVAYEYYSTFFILNREFKMMYLFSNQGIGSFNLLFIAENLKLNKKHYNFLFNINKKVVIVAVIVLFIQQTINSDFFLRPDMIAANAIESESEHRLYSIYSWVTLFGPGLSFIPIYLMVLEDLDKRNRAKKVMLWIFIGILFALFTKARWIMVNMILSFSILVISKRHKFKVVMKYVTIIPFVLIFAFAGLSMAGVDAGAIVRDRILESDKKDVSQKSAGTRILAFTAFNKFYWKNAFWGKGNIKWGMGGTDKQDYELRKFLAGRSSQIHVGYLSILYMFGLVGGSAFLLFIFSLLRKMYRSSKKTKIWAPFYGIMGFAFANLTLVTFTFFELGLIFCVITSNYFSKVYDQQMALKNSTVNE